VCSDEFQAFVNMCAAMSCKGDINVSLDELCVAELRPSMLLSGDIFPDHLYVLTIKDDYGNEVPNTFGKEDVGRVPSTTNL